ncbi:MULTISPECIES: helix-turn-helix domain-containing protein [unclassified Chryseobacterium]|uniref:helix-turn-helix domain-containing protein n=1 Tax=unclassified Chryseobacterium TaxID=2593645 RepID=UPI0021E60176|nr:MULTISPECIES: helix-turn-helix transcriptional regulator [unclassified Chryseobacterium]MEA1850690.1 helix-turn-helix transcriptional regulator [Chryseobacterium sp. MHB01]
MEKIIEKIAQQRSKKGYTFENMAHELNITPAAYRKIETGETKLSVERLMKISEILNEDLSNLLDIDTKNIFNNQSNEGNGYVETINNDYKDVINDIKDTYDKLIKSKDEQILLLKEQITFLKEK